MINVNHPQAYANVLFRETEDAIWVADNLCEFDISENVITELGVIRATISLQRISTFNYRDNGGVGAGSMDLIYMLWIYGATSELSEH
eukprot:3492818-Rhodomonas_salina.1